VPPVPEVARGTSSTQRAAVPATAGEALVRRSLLDATAGLFRSTEPEPPVIRRLDDGSGGVPMSDELPTRMSLVGPGFAPFGDSGEQADSRFDDVGAPHEERRLDEIVDRVVARIEQRVVDELERRGRRHTPGAF
jgi:hypothetical protein